MNTSEIMPRLRLARMQMKQMWRDYKELQRDYSIWNDVSRLKQDIKENFKKGEVYTAGVSDDAAQSRLDTSRSGLEAWAKANDINITFYTPRGKGEAGAADFEKPLEITVQRNGFFNYGESFRVIDGDTDKVVERVTEKTVNINGTTRTVKSTADETFLRRVYRTVEELKQEVDNK